MIYGKYLDTPSLLFGQEDPSQTANTAKEGLIFKNYGPFSENSLGTQLKPILIYPEGWEQQAEKLISGFEGNIRPFKGFKQTFKTRTQEFKRSKISYNGKLQKEETTKARDREFSGKDREEKKQT